MEIGRIFSVEGTPLTPEITLVEGDGASAAGDDRLDAFPVDLVFKSNGTMVALVQDHDHGGGCLQSLLVLVPDGSSEPAEYLGLGSLGWGPPEHLEASVTVGRDGSLLAAWSEFGIQAQRFAPNETPEAAFFVSKDSVDSQLDPVSALQTGGSFVIAWTETTRDGDGKGIFGRAFAGNGLPRSGDFRINVTTAGDQHNPAIAAARQGPVVVVWLQPNDQGGSDVFARVLSETR